jgi:hypothetical protein
MRFEGQVALVSSRGEAEFTDKLLSAMRFVCGHIEKSASKYRLKGVGNDE